MRRDAPREERLAYARAWRADHPKTPEQMRANNQKAWAKKTAAEKNATWIKYQYGLTPTDVEMLHQAQGGQCPLCGNAISTVLHRTGTHIDHNHTLRRRQGVRGLLCAKCNQHLGVLETRGAAWVDRAIQYLADRGHA